VSDFDEEYDHPYPPIDVEFNQLLHALATEGRIEIDDDESEIVLAAYNEFFGAVWPENPGVDPGDPMWEGVAILFDPR
jgi:hypothetical protein